MLSKLSGSIALQIGGPALWWPLWHNSKGRLESSWLLNQQGQHLDHQCSTRLRSMDFPPFWNTINRHPYQACAWHLVRCLEANAPASREPGNWRAKRLKPTAWALPSRHLHANSMLQVPARKSGRLHTPPHAHPRRLHTRLVWKARFSPSCQAIKMY